MGVACKVERATRNHVRQVSAGDDGTSAVSTSRRAGGGGQEQQKAPPMLTMLMMIGAGGLHSIARGDEPQAFHSVASGPSVEKVVDPC